jgi:hypothetical protein
MQSRSNIPSRPGDDPNEAYDVVPMPDKPYGPSGWWTVTCNGIPVRHFGPDEKDGARRYATDPEYRAISLRKSCERLSRCDDLLRAEQSQYFSRRMPLNFFAPGLDRFEG